MTAMRHVAAAAAILCATTTASFAGEPPADELRVITRNIYVGADIFRVVQAPDPATALAEIVAVYNTVIQTDFPERAEALADEILATQPHLVGLQEVSLIRTQDPGDVLIGNPVPATDVEFDYLQLLLDALAVRGLDYEAVAVVENADVELPLFGMTVRDVRLTDRDVLLARSDVLIDNVVSANFSDNVSVDLSGLQIDFLRGYTAVDAWIGARPYRVVNTHLEVGGPFGAAIQQLQAAELADIFADELLPVVMLGDFNASPVSPPEQAYGQLTAAGNVDIWPLFSALPGFTCCFNETLDDPDAMLSSRIDLVLVRNATTPAATVNTAEVLGDELDDLTPSGLWPSDHAGVFASLSIPVADTDADGIDDLSDNCTLVANAGQRDTDGDGFGNRCDADFNNDGSTNFADVMFLREQFLTGNADADLNGDGIVNFPDLGMLKALFGHPPGPAAPTPPQGD